MSCLICGGTSRIGEFSAAFLAIAASSIELFSKESSTIARTLGLSLSLSFFLKDSLGERRIGASAAALRAAAFFFASSPGSFSIASSTRAKIFSFSLPPDLFRPSFDLGERKVLLREEVLTVILPALFLASSSARFLAS